MTVKRASLFFAIVVAAMSIAPIAVYSGTRSATKPICCMKNAYCCQDKRSCCPKSFSDHSPESLALGRTVGAVAN